MLAQQLAEAELGRRLTLSEFEDLLRSSGDTIHDGDDEDDNVTNTGLDFPRVNVLALGESILTMSGPGPGTYKVELTSGWIESNVNFGNQGIDFGDAPDDEAVGHGR